MSIKDAVQLVSENLYGANGKMSREEMVADAKSAVVDWVFETLLEAGIRFEDQNVYRAIESLVARGMVYQAENEAAFFNDVMKAA